MAKSRTPQPIKLSSLERRLAGPPPRPTPIWQFEAIVWERFPQPGRGPKFTYRGLDLTYDGRAWFSNAHHSYRIWLGGERNRRARIDPVGMVIEVAEQLAIPACCVSVRLARMNWPKSSPGLCECCWQSGRRIAGRTFLRTMKCFDGRPLVRTATFCEAHLQSIQRCTQAELTEVP